MQADRPDGMLPAELLLLKELIQKQQIKQVLEIGLANASSSIAILEQLSLVPGGKLTSIDPFQNRSSAKTTGQVAGYDGVGLKHISDRGFNQFHNFIESPSYLALPELIKAGQSFDLVLIDGYHSFDYTFIDFFYVDLLLTNGGLVVFHDSNMPAVYAVCHFAQIEKSYKCLGPKPIVDISGIFKKGLRRLRYLTSGRYGEFLKRQNNWHTLTVLQKTDSVMCRERYLKSFHFSH